MSESIRVSGVVPASTVRVYEAYLSGDLHSAMTGSPATVIAEVGGRLTAWGDYIKGEILELGDGRIVQTWRSSDFPEDAPHSRLEVLIEPEGDPKKLLRVTLPLGMQLVHGTRVIVDQNQPMTAPYVICFTNGCMADYDATADLIAKMKKGQGLVIQAINSTGQPISLVLPLADFAKAYDGPPTDPKVFEEQQKKLQEELQRRADEARKKLESQQGQPQSSNAPPASAPQASGKP